MSRRRHRIMMLINYLAPVGGAEVQTGTLARGLAANGHEVTLCCMDRSLVPAEEMREAGVELIELGRSTRSRRFGAMPRLTRLARRADVVHCTMWDSSLWGRVAAVLARRPAIVADHSTDRKVQLSASGAPRARWIAAHNRLLDRYTFATVACANSQRETLLAEGVAGEKIVHIPNGVAVGHLREMAERGLTRSALGVAEGVPLVVQVGLFRPEKNQAGALEAFVEVRRQVPGARLLFVGGGPLEDDVRRRADELGANDWASFLGIRADAPAIMSLADLTLLPSISDAMPMTVIESMAVGTPVLATDVGDVARMLEGAGVCIEPENSRALAEECAGLLQDPGRRAQMAAEAARRAPLFDSAAMVERYERLFDAAVAGDPPPKLG